MQEALRQNLSTVMDRLLVTLGHNMETDQDDQDGNEMKVSSQDMQYSLSEGACTPQTK